jgi:hypothetical protein
MLSYEKSNNYPVLQTEFQIEITDFTEEIFQRFWLQE